MKGSMGRVAGALVAAAMAATALAGAKGGTAVYINTAGSYANGEIGYVRNTPNAVEYIGCSIGTTYAQCWARNAAGFNANCTTTDPATMTLLRALSGDSYLNFGWNPDGTCRDVWVQQYSVYAPK